MAGLLKRLFKQHLSSGSKSLRYQEWKPIDGDVTIGKESLRIILVKESVNGNKSLVFDTADDDSKEIPMGSLSRNIITDTMLGAMPLSMQGDCFKVGKHKSFEIWLWNQKLFQVHPDLAEGVIMFSLMFKLAVPERSQSNSASVASSISSRSNGIN